MKLWKRLVGLAKPFWKSLAFVLCTTLAAQVVGFLPQLAQKRMFDALQGWIGGASPDMAEVARVVAIVIGAGILSGLAGDLSAFVSERLQRQVAHRLAAEVASHALQLSLGFHTRHDTAEKNSAVSDGLGSAHQMVWVALTQIIPTVFQGIVYGAFAWRIDPIPGALVFVGALVSLSLFLWQGRLLLDDRRASRAEGRSIQRYQADAFRNIRFVKAAALEPAILGELGRRNGRAFGIDATLARRYFSMMVGQTTARTAMTGAVLAISVWQMARNEVTLGTVTLLISVSRQVVGSMEGLVRNHAFLQRLHPDAEKLFELLDVKPDVVPPANPVPLGEMHGSIAFESVSFAYPDTAGTIHDVSFYVPAGKTVAIVGPSGAGKTTLMTLLLRGFDPHAGRVRIDGKDLRELDPAEYLSQVGTVAQGSSVFNATVRDNIAFGMEGATDADVEAAAKLADAHEFILGLKDGYRTEVGEAGVRLSGGQQQRLTIARALLRKPRLLLLDEPTSNLDGMTEARIMAEAVERLKGSRTVVIVAHRLSTVALADIVVVLDHGRVVQQGSYADVISKPGLFRQMVEAQR